MSTGTTPKQSRASAVPADAAAGRGRDTLIATGTGAVVLLASLVNFLSHNEYPLLRLEIGLVALFLVAVAVAVGLLYAVMGDVGRLTLQLVLVFVALDLNFDVAVAIVGTAIIAAVFRRRMMPFLGIAAGVVLVTGLLGLGPGTGGSEAGLTRPAAASNAPVLVHIVLDEHVGIEGLLGDTPERRAMQETLKAFYVGHGFQLFGGAYSEYLHTVNAIPQMLNFGVEQRDPFLKQGSEVTTNAYFERLAALGYAIHVYQTDFLGYCTGASVVSCRTRRASDLHDLVDAAIPVGEKFRLAINELARLSRLIEGAATSYDLIGVVARHYSLPLPPYRLDTHRLPTAIGALDTFDRLTEEVRHARPGNAYFVHELLPHYPYVVDATCRLKDTADWHNRHAVGISRPAREAAYFDQVACLLTKLDALFQALAASPAGAEAIVVIHGDHGWRITDRDAVVETESRFDDDSLIAGHATLFAVRAPAMAPGYRPWRLPVARLLDALAGSRFRSAEVSLAPGFVHSIVLENRAWEPVRRHPLPGWWIGEG